MLYFILNLFRTKEKNVFDERFGFILRNKIDNDKSYNVVKDFFFCNHLKPR